MEEGEASNWERSLRLRDPVDEVKVDARFLMPFTLLGEAKSKVGGRVRGGFVISPRAGAGAAVGDLTAVAITSSSCCCCSSCSSSCSSSSSSASGTVLPIRFYPC